MNVVLWIIAGLLAALFAAAGLTKLVASREKLATTMSWTEHAPLERVRMLGAAEVAGAIGLIAPAALDIAPVLVPVAAICLAGTMVGALAVHLKLHEAAKAAPVIVIGILCVLVAWGRLGPHAF